MKKIILSLTLLAAVITFTGCAELSKLSQAQKKTPQKKPGQTQQAQKPGQTQQGTKTLKVAPNGVRYKDNVFATYTKTVEVFATNVPKYGGGTQPLKMKIYNPEGDNQKNRPCIIFCFGGGFATRVNTGMEDFMSNFVSKGYVSVDINYRLGFNDANGMFFCTGNPYNIAEACYRAAQDARAAVRYLRANADRLGIDEDKIFLGGISAGAITSLHAVYTDTDEIDPAVLKEWGGLDAVGSAKNIDFKVAGVYCFSPSVFDMKILDKAGPPTFIMQGTNDEILDINQGVAFSCEKNKNFPVLYGGQQIFERLKSLGTCTYFTVVCGGHHDLGLPIPEHVDRATEFMFNVMKGTCKTGKDFTKSEKYSGGGNYPGCN